MFTQIQEIINNWLPKAKAKIEESTSEIEAKLMNIETKPISNSLFESLEDKIQELETNLVYQNLVKENLSDSLEKWSKKIPLTNHLVITGLPVENLTKICHESLNKLELEGMYFLEKMPIEYDEDILVNYITDQLNKIKENEEKQIIIIPDIRNFFLRSVKGLDLMENLLITIKETPKNFWFLGCSNWLWNYLDQVCQINSYLDNKIPLPPLKDTDLKEWLSPVFNSFKFEWLSLEKIETKSEINLEIWSSEKEKKFFQNLASVACSSQLIAGNVWLNCLAIIEVEIEENKEQIEEDKSIKTEDKIIAKLPMIPNFNSLEQLDRLLLVAIGLHGKISLNNLAFILGEELFTIKNQAFKLIKLKMLNSEENLVYLNPLYYPKLINDLKNNNLLTDLE